MGIINYDDNSESEVEPHSPPLLSPARMRIYTKHYDCFREPHVMQIKNTPSRNHAIRQRLHMKQYMKELTASFHGPKSNDCESIITMLKQARTEILRLNEENSMLEELIKSEHRRSILIKERKIRSASHNRAELVPRPVECAMIEESSNSYENFVAKYEAGPIKLIPVFSSKSWTDQDSKNQHFQPPVKLLPAVVPLQTGQPKVPVQLIPSSPSMKNQPIKVIPLSKILDEDGSQYCYTTAGLKDAKLVPKISVVPEQLVKLNQVGKNSGVMLFPLRPLNPVDSALNPAVSGQKTNNLSSPINSYDHLNH